MDSSHLQSQEVAWIRLEKDYYRVAKEINSMVIGLNDAQYVSFSDMLVKKCQDLYKTFNRTMFSERFIWQEMKNDGATWILKNWFDLDRDTMRYMWKEGSFFQTLRSQFTFECLSKYVQWIEMLIQLTNRHEVINPPEITPEIIMTTFSKFGFSENDVWVRKISFQQIRDVYTKKIQETQGKNNSTVLMRDWLNAFDDAKRYYPAYITMLQEQASNRK